MTTDAAGRAGPGRRGQGRLGAEAGQVADPVVVPGPGWQDVPAQTGRRTCGRGRARRGGRVRGAGSEPAGRGHRCGRVPPDQSLARVAVSADVDSPVVGSDRGSSPGGRRGRALEEAASGRCPGGGDTAEGIAGVGGQDVRAAWPAGGDGIGGDLAWQGRCPRAELSLRSRHGDLCDRRSGGPLPEKLVEGTALGPGRRGLPVACVPRGALPVGRRRGGGSGHVHRGRAEPRVRRAQRQPSTARATDYGEFARGCPSP